MPDDRDEIDISSLMGAKRAHEQDQLTSGLQDGAETLHAYYASMVAAGFTDAQAFALTMQWHRLFLCRQFGLRD